MMLVLDNNMLKNASHFWHPKNLWFLRILFSLMKPDSANSYLFSSIKAEFFAPEFIKSEFSRYKKDCLSKSKLSEHEFEIRQKEVEEDIEFIKVVEYEELLEIATASVSDPDDVDFLAVALSINSAIWSNDPHIKQQSLVKVFTTAELIEKLLKNEVWLLISYSSLTISNLSVIPITYFKPF